MSPPLSLPGRAAMLRQGDWLDEIVYKFKLRDTGRGCTDPTVPIFLFRLHVLLPRAMSGVLPDKHAMKMEPVPYCCAFRVLHRTAPHPVLQHDM